MGICRYYQQGRCRFGDRCWNEHIDSSPTPQRKNNYTWVSESVSSRNYPQTQFSRGNFSNQSGEPGTRYSYANDYNWNNSAPRNQYYDRNGSGNVPSSYYDRHGSSNVPISYYDRHGSGNVPSSYYDRRGSGNVPNSYYDHHSSESYERSKSPKQSTYFPTKQSNRFEVLSQVNNTGNADRESNLISSVKNDITEWEETHIWPFSCHSHFKDHGACLSGFVDLSPEELRCRAYEAEKSGSFVVYTGIVTDAMNEVKKKWDVLKNPTTDVLNSIKSYQGTPDFCAENLKKLIGDTATGPFGGQVNSEMFIQDNSDKASSGSFSFKVAHMDSSQPLGSSTSAFKSVLPTANKMESSFQTSGASSSASSGFGFATSSGFGSSSSGFGSSTTSVLASSSTASISSGFGSRKEKQDGNTKTSISSESGVYTPEEDLTESELDQFNSKTFTLGKIPSRPPPVGLIAMRRSCSSCS